MQPQNHAQPADNSVAIHQGLADLLDLKLTMLKTVVRYLVLAALLELGAGLVLCSSSVVWRTVHWILNR